MTIQLPTAFLSAAGTVVVAAPAVTVVTTATAAATLAAVATAATAAFLTRTGRTHSQRTVLEFLAIEHADGVLHIRLIFHFNESKSLGSARVAVFD